MIEDAQPLDAPTLRGSLTRKRMLHSKVATNVNKQRCQGSMRANAVI